MNEIRKGFVGKAVGVFIKIEKMRNKADKLEQDNNYWAVTNLTKDEFFEYAKQTNKYLDNNKT